MSREEIEGLRMHMMQVADPAMREILQQMEARALECQQALKQPRVKPAVYKPRRRRAEPSEGPVSEPVWEEDRLPETLWQELARLPEEQAFWDEISMILLPDDEPSEPLFPE